ncbi:MAG: DUF2249 domain-containing protein [Planctomycetes bacterium]|nr:DUF2249 domain-containing protein [Planctomycetota bacterium]
MRELVLDAQELTPPEPMRRVLELLAGLGPDECVVFRHRHAPLPLYPLLAELGFRYRERPGVDAAVEVVIWRGDVEPAP